MSVARLSGYTSIRVRCTSCGPVLRPVIERKDTAVIGAVNALTCAAPRVVPCCTTPTPRPLSLCWTTGAAGTAGVGTSSGAAGAAGAVGVGTGAAAAGSGAALLAARLRRASCCRSAASRASSNSAAVGSRPSSAQSCARSAASLAPATSAAVGSLPSSARSSFIARASSARRSCARRATRRRRCAR